MMYTYNAEIEMLHKNHKHRNTTIKVEILHKCGLWQKTIFWLKTFDIRYYVNEVTRKLTYIYVTNTVTKV